MLAYNFRFHGYNALRYVYKNGQTQRDHYMTIKYVTNPRRKTPRLAVVVSKKVLKSAVGRNRIRRRLYEQFRLLVPHLPEQVDIACIVSSSEIRTLPNDEIKTLLTEALVSANL